MTAHVPYEEVKSQQKPLVERAHGESLVVQWLGLCASTAGGQGSIPGWGTKIPQAVLEEKKKKAFVLEPEKSRS